MTTQPEAELEATLIDQLQSLKYTRVKIKDQAAMLANLKQQSLKSITATSPSAKTNLNSSSTTSTQAQSLNAPKYSATDMPSNVKQQTENPPKPFI